MPKFDTVLYYAVSKGKEVGIFSTWEQVSPLVQGFPGARFKKFKQLEKANDFLRESGIDPRSLDASHRIDPPRPVVSTLETQTLQLDTLTISTLRIYCDGACRGNGKETAISSYGIFFGDNDTRNEKGVLPHLPHTNQRAELYAIIRTLEKCDPDHMVEIFSDSSYSIQCYYKYLPGWYNRGFKTAKGAKPLNLDLILWLEKLMKRFPRAKLIHVRGHGDCYGNNQADKLANLALDDHKKGLSFKEIK